MKCKVISMTNADARRARVVAMLSKEKKLDWSFFNAFGPRSDIGLNEDSNKQIRLYGRNLTTAEIGCFKSHYSVIKDHADNGSGWLLVLEDDVYLDSNFDFTELIHLLEKNGIGYCRLFAKAYKQARCIASLSGFRQLIRFSTDPYGTQAYLIDIHSARDFIGSVNDISLPIDDEMGRFWKNGLVPYCIFPFPCIELAVPSSISNDRDEYNSSRNTRSLSFLYHKFLDKIHKTYFNFLTWRG